MGSPLFISGSSGGRSASAFFTISGGNLVITLTNTATSDTLVPTDLLTGVFFDLAGASVPSVAGGSASIAGGSGAWYEGAAFTSATSQSLGGTFDPINNPWNGTDVGSEFALKGGLSGAPGSASWGLSSTGLGLFGAEDRFDTVNDLAPPPSPDGPNFGISSAGDDVTTGNAGVFSNPIIQYSVVFTLTGILSGFDPSVGITNVWFQYGTALNEPHFPGDEVPLPAGGAMAAVGVAGLCVRRRRRI
jgi:MYXO-CTERM domain-containing protein